MDPRSVLDPPLMTLPDKLRQMSRFYIDGRQCAGGNVHIAWACESEEAAERIDALTAEAAKWIRRAQELETAVLAAKVMLENAADEDNEDAWRVLDDAYFGRAAKGDSHV